MERRFGRKRALVDATFEIQPGEIICLIGNNGAGKTTLLQLLAGLLVPTSGELLVDHRPLDRRDEKLRRRMAVLPDFPPYFVEHTVLKHLAMVCALYAVEDPLLENKAMALMEEIGIMELGNAKMGTLSRGEAYKVAFVALALVKPDLWLLDEPMASGMDPRGLSCLRDQLQRAAAAGATIVYSTQIAEVAERFADRVFVLSEGRILQQAKIPDLLQQTGRSSLEEALQKLVADEA